MHVPLLRPVGTDRPVLDTSIAEPPDLPPLRSNIPGSFAWGVLHQRHPELISQIRHAHPYLPEQHRALDDLLDEITTGPIRALDRAAPDHAAWDALGSGYLGQRWADVPFLWAESYFYRKLLDAVGFFTPGSWFWLDPFAFLKTAELHDPALEVDLLALDELRRLVGAGVRAAHPGRGPRRLRQRGRLGGVAGWRRAQALRRLRQRRAGAAG